MFQRASMFQRATWWTNLQAGSGFYFRQCTVFPTQMSSFLFFMMISSILTDWHSLTHSLTILVYINVGHPSQLLGSFPLESNSSPPSFSILWIHGWQSTVTDVGLDTFGLGLSWPTSTPLARDNEVPHHANASIGGARSTCAWMSETMCLNVWNDVHECLKRKQIFELDHIR